MVSARFVTVSLVNVKNSLTLESLEQRNVNLVEQSYFLEVVMVAQTFVDLVVLANQKRLKKRVRNGKPMTKQTNVGDIARDILNIWNDGYSPLSESDRTMLFRRITDALNSQSLIIQELLDVVKLVDEVYSRISDSESNFIGDDEHELWNKAIEIRTKYKELEGKD